MTVNLFDGAVFFVLASIITIPALILGLLEKKIKYYGLCASIIVLVIVMGAKPLTLVQLALYYLIQMCLIKSVTRIAREGKVNEVQYWLHVCISILPLAIVKILTFSQIGVLGFLGLSYMTFKSVQVIIEISDGVIKDIKPLDFLYFITFFPAVLCGPIDRSRRFLDDTDHPIPKKEYADLVGVGLLKILLGAVYKFVLANLCTIAGTANMYVYGFYLYFDFAGYSLMAIGFSYMFGIRTPANFKSPWISTDIKEFWNRWHITLSMWLRDFLFSRILRRCMRAKAFGGNRTTIVSVCLIFNMTVMGIWHGLELHYIVYGFYHGVLLALTEVYQKKIPFHKKHRKDKWYLFISWLITFHLVMIGFYIFSGQWF